MGPDCRDQMQTSLNFGQVWIWERRGAHVGWFAPLQLLVSYDVWVVQQIHAKFRGSLNPGAELGPALIPSSK